MTHSTEHRPGTLADPLILGRPSPAALAAQAAAPLRGGGEAADACYRAEGGRTDWCALRAATVAGVRHRLAGQAGEDSFAWAHGPGRLAVGVADGLGSVSGSGACAARAVAAACAAAAASPADAATALADGLQAGNAVAAEGGATTLVLAVVQESGQVELGRIGDSTAFLVEQSPTGWVDLFPHSDAGGDDGIETATDALPQPGPLQPERVSIRVDPTSVLVLASDGVADPWRDGPTTVAPVLARAIGDHPTPLRLAHLADFSRQGCHDDRTLVVVWLIGSEEPRSGDDPDAYLSG